MFFPCYGLAGLAHGVHNEVCLLCEFQTQPLGSFILLIVSRGIVWAQA